MLQQQPAQAAIFPSKFSIEIYEHENVREELVLTHIPIYSTQILLYKHQQHELQTATATKQCAE